MLFSLAMLLYLIVFENESPLHWKFDNPFGVLGCTGLYTMFVIDTQEYLLHLWIAKHFEEILSTYQPWPKGKPF